MSYSDLVTQILATSNRVPAHRSEDTVFRHIVEEVGELAEELTIATGQTYKTAGPDGVIGESVDAIISLVDMIYVHAQRMGIQLTQEMLMEIAAKKLAKWEENVKRISNR